VAEIHQSSNESAVVMVSLARAETQPAAHDAPAVVIHKALLWSQPDRILDVAVIDGSPAHMAVLEANGVNIYKLQDTRWQPEQSLPVSHSRPWMDSFICSTALLIRGRGSSVGVAISLLCGATADQAGRYWQLAAAAVRTIPFALMNFPIASRYRSATQPNWMGLLARSGLNPTAPPRLQFCRTQIDMKRSASALIAAASVLIAAESMAATRPHYGGTLRIAVQAAPTSLDPADSSQPDSFNRRNVSHLIFDTLVD